MENSRDDQLLSPEQVAQRLKVTTGWLSQRRFYGNGPAYVKFGKFIRYPEDKLAEFIAGNMRLSTSAPASSQNQHPA